MTDFDTVRDALTFASPTGDETHDAIAALDRIEQDVAGLKVELADASAEIARLRRIEEAAREVCRPYRTGETWSLKPLRTALEGGGSAQEEA